MHLCNKAITAGLCFLLSPFFLEWRVTGEMFETKADEVALVIILFYVYRED